MSDEVRHQDNGAELAEAARDEDRSLLLGKPILEWTGEDWQLWASGLADPTPAQAADARPRPSHPEPASTGAGPETDLAEEGPGSDPGTAAHPEGVPAEAEASPAPAAAPEDGGAEGVDPPSLKVLAAQVEPPASPSAPPSGLVAVGPNSVERLETPGTGRGRVRSAVRLLILAIVVGAIVASLITSTIVVSGLVLRRVLG